MKHWRRLLTIILLLAAGPAQAQNRPLSGSTLTTTDTSANSVLVGCAIGSTSCTGGVKAGPISGTTITGSGVGSFGSVAVTSGETIGGTLGVTGAATLSSTLGVSGITTLSVAGTALKIGSAGAPQANVAKTEYYHNAAYSPWGSTNTAGAADEKYWQWIHGATTFGLRMVNDANSVTFDPFTVTRVGTTAATLTLNGALTTPQTTAPASFSTDQNNYAPAGLATTFAIELNNTDSVSHAITGLAGGTAGMTRLFCVSATSSKGVTLPQESASSTAANRWMGIGGTTIALANGQCVLIWYSGAASRWYVGMGV